MLRLRAAATARLQRRKDWTKMPDAICFKLGSDGADRWTNSKLRPSRRCFSLCDQYHLRGALAGRRCRGWKKPTDQESTMSKTSVRNRLTMTTDENKIELKEEELNRATGGV